MPVFSSRAQKPQHKTHARAQRAPFECIALLLQGGGALGAYQGGVYQALSEAGLHPDWVAGISIGAINSALIAGNAPAARVDKLRQFWERVTAPPFLGPAASLFAATKDGPLRDFMDQIADAAASLGAAALAPFSRKPVAAHVDDIRSFWSSITGNAFSLDHLDTAVLAQKGDLARGIANWLNANLAIAQGAPGFFAPRPLVPWLQPPGSIEATSYFDTAQLKSTLESMVDFDRINAGEMRFSVGAVNINMGNFVYFDNASHVIGPQHIMASGAMPPGFPPVEIEGEFYWDGGLVSNTPLQWVLESEPRRDTLAFQVDLWSARGDFPRNMAEVATRQKEIQYSSRTRANSDHFKSVQKIRNTLASLLDEVPDELKQRSEYAVLQSVADRKVYNLIQLIYRSKTYEGDSKDYEFSRQSMQEHWRAGYYDTVRTLRHREVLERPKDLSGVLTFDLAHDGRE